MSLYNTQVFQIYANHIQLSKRQADIIKQVNQIVIDDFGNIPLEKNELKIFFKEEEEYYSYLGFDKPYRNLVVTDGFYDKEFQEIFIRKNAKSVIRTYIHELGHFLDYNYITSENGFENGSVFTRKVLEDMPFEDQVLKDIKKMPATTLINVASSSQYIFNGSEVFARLFEVYIRERLGRKYFTPDLYIKTPKLFLFLNQWLAKNKSSRWYQQAQDIHLYLLKRAIDRRRVYDPFKRDRFSHYVSDFLID